MKRKKEKDLAREEENVIDAEEEGLISEKWSPTKLLIGLTIFMIVFGAGAYFFLSYKRYQEDMGNNILGVAQNKQEEELPTEEDVEETLENLQQELNNVNPGNLFSSQDSINKMISDLETLRKSSQDPKAAFCSAVCAPQKVTKESTSSAKKD